MRKLFLAALIATLGYVIFGCSAPDPVSNTLEQQSKNLPAGVTSWLSDGTPSEGQGNLGLFSVQIDTLNLKAEMTSLRKGALPDVLEAVDITNFMQIAPCVDCVKIKSVQLNADNNLVVTIGIKHPFSAGDPFKPISGRNRGDLHVFNVEGIVVTDGSGVTDFAGIGKSIGSVKLLNADGYTGYLDASLDSILETQANIHPYILHFDDYSAGNFAATNPMGFESVTNPPPSGNLVMPMGSDYDDKDYVFDTEDSAFDFIFAVGCTYAVASSSKSQRFNPEYRVPQHLKKAASEVHVTVTRNELSAGMPASDADIQVGVVDISHGVQVGDGLDQMYAASDVASVSIDIPGIISAPASITSPTSGTGHDPSDPLLFNFTISNELSAGQGTYPGLVKVLDSYLPGQNSSPLLAGKDGITRVGPVDNPLTGLFVIDEFATYQLFEISILGMNNNPVVDPVEGCPTIIAGIPWIFTVTANDPDPGQTLTYYWDNGENTPGVYDDGVTSDGQIEFTYNNAGNYIIDVRVEDGVGGAGTSVDPFEVEVLPSGIFVDADNTGDPSADGSLDHPYDRIQTGIDNATSTGYIYVLPATLHYGGFTVKSEMTVMGFDMTCGIERPIADIGGGYIFTDSSNNSTIANIVFSIDVNFTGDQEILIFRNSTYLSIENCRITGESEANNTSVVRLNNVDNSSITNCEFVNFRFNGNPSGYRYGLMIYGSDCNTFTLMHNEFHDLGIPDLGSESEWSGIYGYHFGYPQSSFITVKNNLFYNFWDHSPAIPQPSGDKSNVIHAMSLGNTNDYLIDHNTIDNFDCNNGDSQKNAWTVGLYCGMAEGVLKNNVFKSLNYFNGSSALYHNSAGFWADSSNYVMADYSCVYWGTPPPPGWPCQTFSYLNRISKGAGSYDQNDLIDPDFDYTSGANFYHPLNSTVASGAEDGSEMGCFGGPDGDWTPPSQIYN